LHIAVFCHPEALINVLEHAYQLMILSLSMTIIGSLLATIVRASPRALHKTTPQNQF
jgi:hypothetical protein